MSDKSEVMSQEEEYDEAKSDYSSIKSETMFNIN
jgi:hypothetical protein